jgi:nicotinamidase-related amidase
MHKAAFTPENAAMLLIDHQLGAMGWTHSHDINLVEANALKLAKIAKALDLPVVLTASMEDQVQGPLCLKARRSFRKSSHDASCLQVLGQQHCRSNFATQIVNSRGPNVPMRNAKVAPVERHFNGREICNVAAIE